MPSTKQTTSKPVVLAVDDCPDTLLLVQKAARKKAAGTDFRTLNSGEEAIAYIFGTGNYSDRTAHPIPRLLLLDLNMPRVSGFEVLTAISKAQISRRPFTCIWTTSKLPEDIAKATALGVDAFHTKPENYNDLCDLLGHLVEFTILDSKPTKSL